MPPSDARSGDFSPTAPDPKAVFAAGALIAAIRHAADDLEEAARRLHAGDELTVGERRILLLLRQGGAQTIPQLATRREASRQYVQQALAPLAERGLVAWRDNPRHRRSKLAELTPEGAAMARRVMAREGDLLRALSGVEATARLQAASEVLAHLREALNTPLRAARAEG